MLSRHSILVLRSFGRNLPPHTMHGRLTARRALVSNLTDHLVSTPSPASTNGTTVFAKSVGTIAESQDTRTTTGPEASSTLEALGPSSAQAGRMPEDDHIEATGKNADMNTSKTLDCDETSVDLHPGKEDMHKEQTPKERETMKEDVLEAQIGDHERKALADTYNDTSMNLERDLDTNATMLSNVDARNKDDNKNNQQTLDSTNSSAQGGASETAEKAEEVAFETAGKAEGGRKDDRADVSAMLASMLRSEQEHAMKETDPTLTTTRAEAAHVEEGTMEQTNISEFATRTTKTEKVDCPAATPEQPELKSKGPKEPNNVESKNEHPFGKATETELIQLDKQITERRPVDPKQNAPVLVLATNVNEVIAQALHFAAKHTKDADKTRNLTRAAQDVAKHQDRIVSGLSAALAISSIQKPCAEIIDEFLGLDKMIAKSERKGKTAKTKKTAKTDKAVQKSLQVIAGLGPIGARSLMEAYPIRTLADIYKNVPSKVLSPMQFAGLKHLDDFRKQIPREEMTTWETLLKETAQSVVPGMQVELGGIYRRSCLFSQKITVHMTHESWESSGSSWDNGRAGSLMLQQLHDKLIRKGVLVDDIKYSKRLVEHSGVYRLPDGVCRRLEIQISPYDRHWYALFLSTRSNKLITRLRTKATSMGYQLERGYILDSQGVALKGLQSEEDLFAKLDEVYEPPSN